MSKNSVTYPVRVYHDYVLAKYIIGKKVIIEELLMEYFINAMHKLCDEGYMIDTNIASSFYKNRVPKALSKIESWITCNVLRVIRNYDDLIIGYEIKGSDGRAILEKLIKDYETKYIHKIHVRNIIGILKEADRLN